MLSTAGIAVHEAIAPVLAAPALRTRFGAAYALSLLGPSPPGCIPVLLEALGADDGDLRWAAATLLLPFGSGVLLQPLRELVRSGNVGAAQDGAVLSARRRPPLVGPRSSAPRSATRPVVRLAAMAALARLAGSGRVSRAIVRLLDDPDVGVRRAAAATLGRLGVADAPCVTRWRAPRRARTRPWQAAPRPHAPLISAASPARTTAKWRLAPSGLVSMRIVAPS